MMDDLQVTDVACLIMDISLGLSFMFFVQAKAVTGAGICTEDDRLRQVYCDASCSLATQR